MTIRKWPPASGGVACLILCLQCLLVPVAAVASSPAFKLNLQYRYYPQTGESVDEQHYPSLGLSMDYQTALTDNTEFTTQLTGRWDSVDDERSGGDIRELLWHHHGGLGHTRIGLGQVAWGVNEFFKITDIVNQKDRRDLPYPKKLGQPMVASSFYWQDDLIELYTLYDVRDAWYPGEDGRLRYPILVDNDEAEYDRGQTGRWDFAVRYKTRWGDADLALSHFYGMSRDPYYVFNSDFNDPRLIPVYEKVNQTSLEWVLPWQMLLLKGEAIVQTGGVEQYESVAVGMEYPWGPVGDTQVDLTLYSEAIWDSRDNIPTTLFDHDVALAGRLSFNDSADSHLMLGAIVDYEYNEAAGFLFFTRYLADSLVLNVAAQAFHDREPRLNTEEFQRTTNQLVAEVQGQQYPLPDQLIATLLGYFQSTTITRRQYDRLRETLEQIQTDPDYLSQVDLESVPQTLFDLLRVSANSQKLNLIERDAYLQVDLIYHF